MGSVKRYLSLFIAIGFATLSSLGIYHYLQNHEKVTMAQPAGILQPGVETFPVIVAKRDLAAGEELRAEDLDIHQWPGNVINELYFQAKSQIVGKVLRADLVANEPVIATKLLGEDDTFASLIPDNKSAVTITVPRTDMLSRTLKEGSIVDIFATYDRDSSGEAKVIARGAYVISADGNQDKGKSGSRMEVTLLVASRFTAQIIYAITNGEIQLIMSGKHDAVLEIT